MKIQSAAVSLPSRRVSNEDILHLIEEQSRRNFCGDLSKLLRTLRVMLKGSGSETRAWLAIGESPLSITVEACRKSLAELKPGERVDMLLYASVFPFLTEPSSASLIAHELGLDDVECLDLKQACCGWVSAANLAEAYLDTKRRTRIMVVNAEFSMVKDYAISPKLFEFRALGELEWRFPAFTIGEGASAMIFTSDPSNEWRFGKPTFRNDLYDLCSVTPRWYGQHPISSPRVGKDGAGIFTSYGADLLHHGFDLTLETWRNSGLQADQIDILFTHASSKKDWGRVAESIGLTDKIYDIYSRYGNLVSGSVPAALALAAKEGGLRRGMRVGVLVASAGMAFHALHFTY